MLIIALQIKQLIKLHFFSRHYLQSFLIACLDLNYLYAFFQIVILTQIISLKKMSACIFLCVS